MKSKVYIAIDLKSFYASVECRERGLDPLDTNLVVADASRTDKTICLAVTPALKSYGIPGRARLFEVKQKVNEENLRRELYAPNQELTGSSYSHSKLKESPELALDFLIAPPRMAYYMKYSTKVYEIYMKYVAPEDIVVYSIDEVFIDASHYLNSYKLSPRDFAMQIILDVLNETGITATAGIAENLFLCKVALDIVAKHIPADKNGVRIAELDEMTYRHTLWDHQPITDFWRIGKGYAKRLAEYGIFTMGDVAQCSVRNEDLLYRLFGVNAELLIDHAWGWEPCTIADIKAYKPTNNSLCFGQVLPCPYTAAQTRLVVKETADLIALDLVDKHLVTNQIVMTIGYDIENISKGQYGGKTVTDRYGRQIPQHSHGTINLDYTSSTKRITDAALNLYDKIINKDLLVRRLDITTNHVIDEDMMPVTKYEQLDLFTDYSALQKKEEQEKSALEKERKMQQAMLLVKKKFGKNAILKGMNLQKDATAKDRNGKIGGHKA